MFRKILVPYDGTKQSENALNKAIDLAKLISGSEVLLLTVMEEVKTPTLIFDTKVRDYKTGEATTLSNYMRNLHKDFRRNKIIKLNEIKHKYQKLVPIRTQVSVGRPELKIVQYANNHHIDLIIMGSRGLKGISRFLMGSVSRSVLEKAKCTVMITR
jgi:nucleotide-binding universal stress UspA family protein